MRIASPGAQAWENVGAMKGTPPYSAAASSGLGSALDGRSRFSDAAGGGEGPMGEIWVLRFFVAGVGSGGTTRKGGYRAYMRKDDRRRRLMLTGSLRSRIS
jgi:hypothetical protein